MGQAVTDKTDSLRIFLNSFRKGLNERRWKKKPRFICIFYSGVRFKLYAGEVFFLGGPG